MKEIVVLSALCVLGVAVATGQEYGGHALFVRTANAAHSRVQRATPASPADVMAHNILEWIQGIYRQGARKIRQQAEGYLPPYSTQRPPERPRPFQAPSTVKQTNYQSSSQNDVTGYPFQRPSSLYTPPSPSFPTNRPSSEQAPPFSTPKPTYLPPSQTPFGPSTSYNPRPSTPQPTYSNTGSTSFPPLTGTRPTTYLPPQTGYSSTTLRPPSTSQGSQTGGISSGISGGISGSTGFGYSSQRPSSDFASVGGSIGGSSTNGFSRPSGFSSPTGGFSNGFGYSSQRPTPTFSSPVNDVSVSSGGYQSPSGFTTYGYPSERPTPSFPTPTGGSSVSDENTGYPSQTPDRPFPGYPTTGSGGEDISGGTGSAGTGTTGGDGSVSTGGTGTTGGMVSTGGSGSTGGISTGGTSTGGTSTGGTSTGGTSTGGTVTTGGSTGTGVTAPGGDTSGSGSSGTTVTGEEEDDDLKHPPHIHSLDVECSKTMMTINIEFNRAFDGIIYSKGFFMNPECKYVDLNSGKTKYSFTVSLDSCGTQFINDFEGEAGQAYLENVLVLQNEPGIQEVWDTVRRVRCLWEGNINKALTVNFSVDMLNQEIVTFSGDTASAKLDIQLGRGPFAPAADGLVKIGETMTLVVSVEGDPAFDLQVRDCQARDESSTNVVQLTDERGCILKPKLFGAFQKTNDTGNTGASIIAYAFFQAFKFPDVMDLFIECNIELCKTDCEPCPEGNQQIEPGRRRRSINYTPSNSTSVLLADPIRVRRGFKVVMLDDLSTASSKVLEHLEETAIEDLTKERTVCMSNFGFYASFSLMLSTLLLTSILAAVFYVKLQRIYRSKSMSS